MGESPYGAGGVRQGTNAVRLSRQSGSEFTPAHLPCPSLRACAVRAGPALRQCLRASSPLD